MAQSLQCTLYKSHQDFTAVRYMFAVGGSILLCSRNMRCHIHTQAVRTLIVSAAVKQTFYGAVDLTMRQGNHTSSLNLHSTKLNTKYFFLIFSPCILSYV
jgi:hypothetical protein